ncbi:fructokinase-like 1, chloroplastic [Amborella trichopoda]|nr:fructokinase-like 1, chloroplastic [Amborella trichopoda]|eukprot:XP_011624700.1 fructokinase-like 1, chloroplastic [Amborella trichopoda]
MASPVYLQHSYQVPSPLSVMFLRCPPCHEILGKSLKVSSVRASNALNSLKMETVSPCRVVKLPSIDDLRASRALNLPRNEVFMKSSVLQLPRTAMVRSLNVSKPWTNEFFSTSNAPNVQKMEAPKASNLSELPEMDTSTVSKRKKASASKVSRASKIPEKRTTRESNAFKLLEKDSVEASSSSKFQKMDIVRTSESHVMENMTLYDLLKLPDMETDSESDSPHSLEPETLMTSTTTRRTRKKDPSSSPSPKKARRSKKTEPVQEPEGSKKIQEYEEEGDGDDEDPMDFPYEWPPLICCFGAAQREFLPTVRVAERQMHPDIYSTWKGLQWSPPEFTRAPGGPPFNVAISHVRLGGRAAFMGKVGGDDYGDELVYTLNKEKVQTRGTKIDPSVKTALSYMKIVCKDGKLSLEPVKECAEDSLCSSEVDIAVLKEAKIFHFNAEVLTSPSMHSALFRAIQLSKKYGGLIFFDLNLPLPLWRSRDETRKAIQEAWNQANIIELTKQELEFLLDEDYYERKREYKPQYYAESYQQTRKQRNHYHYTREEIAPLWHDNIKILFVTDGTFRIHYYTPSFDGAVIGTEDVLLTPFTCDRTGSGDAVVAGIMRKLTTHPEMYENQDILERQLRFAIAAGIISQWTIGAVRGFPTESATQNLKEQVYVPSMW